MVIYSRFSFTLLHLFLGDPLLTGLQGRKSAMANTGSPTLQSIQMFQIASNNTKIEKVAILQTGANKRLVHNRQTNRIQVGRQMT